jgi:DNA-binding NarL/FixJ family response regulator
MTTMAFAPAVQTIEDSCWATDIGPEPESHLRTASEPTALRVVIANQQPLVRYGLWDVIASEPGILVVGETGDGREAVHLERRLRPDIVLIDLAMPTLDGISATRMIRAERPATQVIIMTGVDADASTLEAISAGAAAYLLNDARIDHLLRTIRGAGAGQVALPARTAARMACLVRGESVLSRRETEILVLVARGLANKQVARELGVTQSTVKAHVHGILSKLGLPSRTQAALYAARIGLVSLGTTLAPCDSSGPAGSAGADAAGSAEAARPRVTHREADRAARFRA